jgi:hypothetical protein
LGVADSNDTAEWADNSALTTDLPTGGLGDYSVKLVNVSSGDIYGYIQLIPTSGTTLSDLEALTNEWSFWYWSVDASPYWGPQLELRFGEPDSTRFVDITVMAAQAEFARPAEQWVQITLADALENVGYWSPDPGIFDDGDNQALSTAVAAVLADEAIDGDWELDRVEVQLYENDPARTFYVDDITIDGTLYELEPIFLDAEYYSVGDTVEVTVPNFAANTDSIRVNPVTGEPATGDPANWSVTVTWRRVPIPAFSLACLPPWARLQPVKMSFTFRMAMPSP